MSSLLPENATSQEKDIEATLLRSSDIQVENNKLWDIYHCPENFLPWLAWAFGVETWSTGWSSTQKRNYIKNAIPTHKKKGTSGAMKQALQSLGHNFNIIEWFQEDVPTGPYTFRLLLSSANETMTEKSWNSINQIIEKTKNARSHLSAITLTRDFNNNLNLSIVAVGGDSVSIFAYQDIMSLHVSSAATAGDSVSVFVYQGDMNNKVHVSSAATAGDSVSISAYQGML
ncbi:MAG: phage tail protein I [Desulfobacteraceae bacterium]|nr:phage tail protein I [Desulfobacteraceae bacterium]